MDDSLGDHGPADPQLDARVKGQVALHGVASFGNFSSYRRIHIIQARHHVWGSALGIHAKCGFDGGHAGQSLADVG
jgi:hypothetical protein